MKTIGLDIGSYAIKAVVGVPKKDGIEILRAVEVPNPIGSIIADNPQKHDQFINAITGLFDEHKLPTGNIRVGLSETLVSTKVVRMPLLSDAELASAIQWQVEQHIPIPLDQMQFEYSVLYRTPKELTQQQMDVLMIGTKKQLVETIADTFLDANINVESMETDTIAHLRLLQTVIKPEENVALLHIGASSTTVVMVSQGVLQFAYVVPVGGILFSRAIERSVGLDATRAEEYKRSYGLLANQLEGRVRQALSPIVDTLSAEVQKALRFFSTQKQGMQVSRIFVSGGSLYLPDLLPYLSQAVSVEMVPIELTHIPGITWKESPPPQDSRFVIATGLAMKQG